MKPYNIENQLVLARSFIEDDPARGVEFYEKIFPKHLHLMSEEDYMELAFAYEDLNRHQDALKVYLALVDAFPQSHRGYYGLGTAYEELGMPDQPLKAILRQ